MNILWKETVEVEVTLRPTVSRPVRPGVLPLSRASDKILHLYEWQLLSL
jgi:hypothetical protein